MYIKLLYTTHQLIEMRMLRWIHGISLKDNVRIEHIRKRAKANPNVIVADATRRRCSWCGHIRRGDPEGITIRVLFKDMHGKRPRIRWMDNIRRDNENIWPNDKMTEDRKVWSHNSGNGRHTLLCETNHLRRTRQLTCKTFCGHTAHGWCSGKRNI